MILSSFTAITASATTLGEDSSELDDIWTVDDDSAKSVLYGFIINHSWDDEPWFKDMFTEQSFAAYGDEYRNAQTVYYDESSTAEQIKSAYDSLIQAYYALEYIISNDELREDLQEQIDTIQRNMPNSASYTAESYKKFSDAMKNAQEVAVDSEAKRSSIIGAGNLLNLYYKNLEYATDTGATDPSSSETQASDSGSSGSEINCPEPVNSDDNTVDIGATDPSSSESQASDSSSSETAASDSSSSESAASDSSASENNSPETDPSQPSSSENEQKPTQPSSSKPAATQPTSSKPAATKPAATKPAPTQPAAKKAVTYKLSKAKIAAIPNKAYTGKAIRPSLKVTYGGKKLVKGKHYTVTFKNNKKIGKATVTIKGKGSYKGTVKRTFYIVKAKNPMEIKTSVGNVKYSKVSKSRQKLSILSVKKAQGKVSFKKNLGSKYLTVSSNGVISVRQGAPKGTMHMKVRVTASGSSNYNPLTKIAVITVIVK